MPPETTITREILWNVPLWAQGIMYVLFAVALAVTLPEVWKRVSIWRRGKPSIDRPPLGTALGRLLRHAVLQVRIWRSPAAGLSHAGIFWGFIVLFIGTCIVGIEEWGAWIFDHEHFIFTGPFYLGVSCALEVFGIAFVAGVVIAMLRRRFDRRYLPLARRADAAILWLFLALGVTGFLLEGLRIAGTPGGMDAHSFERWSFVGWGLACLFRPLSPQVLEPSHLTIWMAHMVMTMAFIALLPYCKLRHIFFSTLNVAIAERKPSGKYLGVSLEEVEATGKYGIAEPGDFTRRQLVSFDACTECARCHRACPATATGKPLSPMRVVLDISEAAAGKQELHGGGITPDVLWACTSCGACVYECPVSIDQLRAIVDLRRWRVGEGDVRGSAQAALRAVAAQGNPWGMPQSDRNAWAEGLGVPSLADEPDPEVLFWVGCAGSYDSRSQKVARALVMVFRAAGVRFAVLGASERCTGDPARRIGDEFTYLELATANVEALRAANPRRIVTMCPHCFHTIGSEYPDLGGTFEVVHHTQFIDELLASGRLRLREDGAAGATRTRTAFHDPCYLGRHNGVYDPPRRALEAAGAELLEPEASREKGFCCGAGGGRMWMEEDIGTRINIARWKQLDVLEPRAVAAGCPFCMTMLRDAAQAEGSAVEVRDVAEIVADRLGDATGSSGAPR